MKRWSPSALFAIQECGERYRRKWIEGERRPIGIAAPRGSSVHGVAKTSHRRQLDTKKRSERERPGDPEALQAAIPTIEEAKDLAASLFTANINEKEVAFTDEEKEEGAEKVKGRVKDTTVAMAGHYVEKIAPVIDPIAVEHAVIVKPRDADFEIKGIMDLVTFAPPEPVLLGEKIPPPDPIVVIDDLKTATKAPWKDAADRSQQLTFYSMLRRRQSGKMPDKVRLKTVVETPKTRKVSHVVQTSTRDLEQVKSLVQRINTAVAAVERGVFIPANPDGWRCSAKYCEFFFECRFAMRPVSVTVDAEV